MAGARVEALSRRRNVVKYMSVAASAEMLKVDVASGGGSRDFVGQTVAQEG